jgi:Cdc6-like AAA superfamily ATPase
VQSTPKENREPLRNYVSRILVPHTDFQQARRRIRQLIRYRESGGTEPKGLAVMGESRTGKSTVLNAVIEEWPRRRDEDGLVVPILVARVPSRPSIIALAKSLLKALGVPDWTTGTEIELTERLKTLLKKCKVMAIALDEFHHFVDRRSEQVQHELADWLKNLIEEAEVCLIVLGVPRMTAVIRQNEQLEGRFLAPVVLPRFDWFQDEQRADWIGILDAFSITLSEHFDVPSPTAHPGYLGRD